MRYAVARYNQHQRDTAYRIYITDCIRILTKNTAMKQGDLTMTKRFADFIRPQPQDNKTGDQIAADVVDWICGGEN